MEDEKFAKKLEAAINKEMREKNPGRGYQHQHGKKAQEAFNQHFKLEKKEPLKPETFQANGKKYVNTTGLTMKSRTILLSLALNRNTKLNGFSENGNATNKEGRKRMTGSVKLVGTTTTLSTNTTLNNAKCVWVRNIDTVDALITVSDTVLNVTLGSVQIAANEVIYVDKRASEVISSNNATNKTLVNAVAKTGT